MPNHSVTHMSYVQKYNMYWYDIYNEFRSQWPRGLRRRSTAALLLRSWVRIPPMAWMFVCCVCCQVEVSATSWSFVQEEYTDCGASLCVITKPRQRGGHSPRWAAEPEKIIIIIIIMYIYIFHIAVLYVHIFILMVLAWRWLATFSASSSAMIRLFFYDIEQWCWHCVVLFVVINSKTGCHISKLYIHILFLYIKIIVPYCTRLITS
jgi:hypothetical protein